MSFNTWQEDSFNSQKSKRFIFSFTISSIIVVILILLLIKYSNTLKTFIPEKEVQVKFVIPENTPKPIHENIPTQKTVSKSSIKNNSNKSGRKLTTPLSIPNSIVEENNEEPVGEEFSDSDSVSESIPEIIDAGSILPNLIQTIEIINPPIPVKQNLPSYPEEARKQSIETVVIAKIYISNQGNIESVKIIDGHPAFHQVVKNTLSTWIFQPATLNSQTISSVKLIKIPFKLK